MNLIKIKLNLTLWKSSFSVEIPYFQIGNFLSVQANYFH